MHVDNLWAPWRIEYLRELSRRRDELAADIDPRDAPKGSFLSEYWVHPDRDEANLVVVRNDRGMILLNRYPYANGHLLVALGEARPRLLDYEPEQRRAFWSLVETAADLMERTLNPQGINLGINQGEAAGAGVAEHLHAHLVPRWGGDTNFITVVGRVRVIPESLEKMAAEYRAALGGR